MKTPLFLATLTVALLGGTLLAQGFNMRTGSWQMTMTMGGAMPMEGIPPAMRAQIEAQLKAPQVVTSCVTAEDVRQLNLGKTDDDGDDDDCKLVSSKITSTAADITRQCSGKDAYTETAHFEAPTPVTMKANISRKSAQGTTTIVMTGKWVAAQCKD